MSNISLNWFKNLLFRSKTQHSKVNTLIGKILFINYDPKTKDALPYYDTLPVILCFELRNDYLLGLNFHYLDYNLRFQLLKNVAELGSINRKGESTINIDYFKVLNLDKYNLAQICFKKYLLSNIKNLLVIPSDEWRNILRLPIHNFKKSTVRKIWAESRKKAEQ